jgi:predicted transcriptional regulator
MQTADSPSSETFDQVLDRLETTLRVDLIATNDLISCQHNEPCGAVLASDEWARFDQFPVKDDDRVIGILERRAEPEVGARAVEAMRPLDDSLIVSASTGILSYIRLATASPYHLVIRDHRICGIVTPSDLLKLPARVVVFTLITHLESTMARTIGKLFPEDEWKEMLSDERKAKLDSEFEALDEVRRDPELLLLTQFSDKRTILAKTLFREGERAAFKSELKELETLRDHVMHSNNYPLDDGYLEKQVASAQSWIRFLDDASMRATSEGYVR